MRFLVDENLPREVAEILRMKAHDAVYVSDTELHGAADSLLVAASIDQDRVIVTQDVKLALEHAMEAPGVVLVRVPRWFRKHEVLEVVERFTGHRRFPEVSGNLTLVEPSRVTARRLRRA